MKERENLVDINIKNCKIVNTEGICSAGIAIDNGKIVAITKDENLPKADKVIDAKGNYVLPGLIDPHVHFGLGRPYEEDCKSETISAAAGGVTTIMLMGLGAEIFPSVKEIFENAKKVLESHTIVDTVFHAGIFSDQHIREIPDYARELGITSFKIPMMMRGSDAEAFGVPQCDDTKVFNIMKAVKSVGHNALAMIHAENVEIYYPLKEKLLKDGRDDLRAWSDARPNVCEAEAVNRVITFADYLNMPIYIVHMSTKEGVTIATHAQANGSKVIVETCPHFLALSWKDLPEKYPQGRCAPPLRDKSDAEKLWWGIRVGIVKSVGTDHCAYVGKDKFNIWEAPNGFPGVETTLPVMLSEGVNKGRIPLEKLVEVCCYNPAKIFGIYPWKGTISVGSDADFVIVDLDKTVKVTRDILHSASDFTPFEGREFKGWPILTMLRGNVVMENGEITGKPGIGRYLPRKKL